METSWHSYPKIWAMGHGAIQELLFDEVVIEEKLDGSQFSFGKFGNQLKCKSRNQEIDPETLNHSEMFKQGVDTAKELFPLLKDGWTYRGEYFQKPKQNLLAYNRAPHKHLILFDINTGEEIYLSREEKEEEAGRLGLEIVPAFYKGKVTDVKQFYSLLETESFLGGQKIEGIVVKNYNRFGKDKKVLMGKYVSESFKENNQKNWRKSSVYQSDILTILNGKYKTTARWEKAVQRLREAGNLEESPTDIGPLIQEIIKDVKVECTDEIMKDLFEWAWPKLSRTLSHGMPEWYKQKLLEKQFTNEN